MAEFNLRHVNIPVQGRTTNDTILRHINIPVEGRLESDLILRYVSIPLSPARLGPIVLKDEYNHTLFPGTVIITNAFLVDKNPAAGYVFDDVAIPFDPFSLTANLTSMNDVVVFGYDPKHIYLRFDVEYQIIAGRTHNETKEIQLKKI